MCVPLLILTSIPLGAVSLMKVYGSASSIQVMLKRDIDKPRNTTY